MRVKSCSKLLSIVLLIESNFWIRFFSISVIPVHSNLEHTEHNWHMSNDLFKEGLHQNVGSKWFEITQ